MEEKSVVDKKELLLNKHINFIANYGKTHDKYVSSKI